MKGSGAEWMRIVDECNQQSSWIHDDRLSVAVSFGFISFMASAYFFGYEAAAFLSILTYEAISKFWPI